MSLLRIELVDNVYESSEELTRTSEVNVDDNSTSALNDEAPLLQVNDNEKCEVDSITNLKKRLQLAEMECSKLERLYQKYRLRWLEENYWARVLNEYAPHGINTCSPRQITWNAPSPAQTEYDTELEDQE
ncbi:hypothetical protein DFH29DRAFT_876377 [Suillus ampliporus]|nr:hypothetical protein DFH29DRAFT_876377 [Suillus ampliporus]